ncbi:MAG: diaminopimelate epimerase [Kiritimatiellia bacterium]|nr:diaminopimelate epimerase [Kiritimatiellia bacterium]
MKVKFGKMHGAGNDFIIVDDHTMRFPLSDRAWIKRICSLHSGIGAEGLILLQPSDKASFRMRFFNPDGLEAEMCGNGVRCAARFANDDGIAAREMTIQTMAGILRASITDNGVRVAMPVLPGVRLNFPVQVAGRSIMCSFINTGVPHVVVETDDLEAVDLNHIGPLLRWHKDFAPQGANIDYLGVSGDHSLRVRTYERGVEAETFACGTGITACAIIAAMLNKVTPPVRVKCRHGDMLEVDFKKSGNDVEDITLLGPAMRVFQGEISYQESPKAQRHPAFVAKGFTTAE